MCNSGHALEIHGMISTGMKYKEVVEELKTKYNFSISPAAISRHMANYKESVKTKAAQLIAEEYDAECDRVALHQKQAATLADLMYQNLEAQIRAGVYSPSVSDWEKLVNLYHRVKSGDDGAMDGLMGMFQVAANRHGFSAMQGVLWQPAQTPEE